MLVCEIYNTLILTIAVAWWGFTQMAMVLMLTCAPLDRGSRAARENSSVESILRLRIGPLPPLPVNMIPYQDRDSVLTTKYEVEKGKIEYWCKIDRVFLTIAWPVSADRTDLTSAQPKGPTPTNSQNGDCGSLLIIGFLHPHQEYARNRHPGRPSVLRHRYMRLCTLRVHIPSNLGQPTLLDDTPRLNFILHPWYRFVHDTAELSFPPPIPDHRR